MSVTSKWPSPAKLNLFLYITGQRADGYHQLQTLFQFLDYGDQLTIEPRDDNQIRLLTPIAGVENEQNLIVRAAKCCKNTLAIPPCHAVLISALINVYRWAVDWGAVRLMHHSLGGTQPTVAMWFN